MSINLRSKRNLKVGQDLVGRDKITANIILHDSDKKKAAKVAKSLEKLEKISNYISEDTENKLEAKKDEFLNYEAGKLLADYASEKPAFVMIPYSEVVNWLDQTMNKIEAQVKIKVVKGNFK